MTPCINHQGHITKYGYGEVWHGGRNWQAHRLMWTGFHGPIPVGMVIMHICDNRACVNIEHLRLGTMGENNEDRDAKGRQARGERVHLAKLTADDIPVIRARRAANDTLAAIAADYGVTRQAIAQAVGNHTWKHIS